jgi:Ubiquitin elongating factor core
LDSIDGRLNALMTLFESTESVCELWSKREDVSVRGWNARLLEDASWLGSLFRMSPLTLRDVSEEEAKLSFHRHRESWTKRVFQLLQVLRRSTSASAMVMQWFHAVCLTNAPRHKMMYHPNTVCSDGLMMNCFIITSLLREAERPKSVELTMNPNLLGWNSLTCIQQDVSPPKSSSWWMKDNYNTLMYMSLNLFHCWFAPLLQKKEMLQHQLRQMLAHPEQREQFAQAREAVKKEFAPSNTQLEDAHMWNLVV